MISNKHFSILSLAVLLALVVAAVLPFAALADDETPPPDAPVMEEVVLEEVPAGDETQPAADETAVEEAPVVDVVVEEDLTVSEAQEQLPEDTALVVVDENGEVLPLASQEAAEVVATADPYFWDGTKIVGFSASGVCPIFVTDCRTSSTPIQAAVDAFAQSQAVDEYIRIDAGIYNEDVEIDTQVGNLSNLAGLVGDNKPIINGNIYLSGTSDRFNMASFVLNGSLFSSYEGGLSVTKVTVNSDENSAIFLKSYSGYVYMENVEANAACEGCRGVEFLSGTGDVTIVDSNFSSEDSAAAKFDTTSGEVYISGGNYEAPNEHGILFDNHIGNVTLNDVTASGGKFGSVLVVAGDVFIDGGDFKGGQAATGIVVEGGNATVEYATLHDSPIGIYYSVTGTLKACNNVFSNNGTNVSEFEGNPELEGNTGTFDDCSPVNPPVEPSANPAASQPVNKENKEYEGNDALVVVHTSFPEGALPGSLPSNASFVAGKNIKFFNGETGDYMDEAPDVWVTLDNPVDMRGQSIRVMFWNGSEWIEVSSFISADGKQITFQAFRAGNYVLVTR